MRSRLRSCCIVGAFGLTWIFAAPSSTQVSDVSLQYHFLQDSHLKEPIPGIASSKDAQFAIGTVDFSARIPVWGTYQDAEAPTNPSRAFGVYGSFQRKFVEELLFTRDSDDLYAIGAQVRYFAAITNTWGWAVVGGTKLPVSSVEKAQVRDLTYQAGGMIRYSTWENGTIGIGALYSQHTGVSYVLPLIHTDLRWFQDKLNLEIAPWAPIEPRASLRYRPSPIWSIGVGAVLAGDLYALNESTADLRDADGNIIAENVNAGLAMSEFLVGPELRVHSGTLELVFIGGIALDRRFEVRAIDQDETLRIPVDDKSEWVPAEFNLESIGTLLVRGTFLF